MRWIPGEIFLRISPEFHLFLDIILVLLIPFFPSHEKYVFVPVAEVILYILKKMLF